MAFSSWRTWVTGETVTAAHMNQEVRDNGEALFPDEDGVVSWSPLLRATGTNPGIASVTGERYRIGALQFVWASFVFQDLGGSEDGSGTYFVTLPVASSGITASGNAFGGQAMGGWLARDHSSVSNSRGGEVMLAASDDVRFMLSGGGNVSATTPFVWRGDDVLSFWGQYPFA